MRRLAASSWTELLVRYIVGITFVYASLHKIAAPAEFAKIIYGYGLVPHDLVNLLAIVLPFVEFVAGGALLLGVSLRGATVMIGAMLLVFMTAISVNLIRGHEFDCGCFSFHQDSSRYASQILLFRDGIYLLLCLYLLAFKSRRLCFMGKRK